MNFSQQCSELLQVVNIWFVNNPVITNIGFCLLWLLVGLLASHLISKSFSGLMRSRRVPPQVCGLLGKICKTSSWFIFITLALSSIGVNVGSILGAAGVLGVAIGFASQTSLSNLICGIFIVTERSIQIGDYIQVDDCEGTVESVNLLSVQLRRIDHSLIRIPNQSLIQNPMTNVTGSKMRRCDLELGLNYASDLDVVKRELFALIKAQPLFMSEPAACVQFLNFGESTLNIRVGAWCKTEDYHQVRYAFAQAILQHFKEKNIDLAFPTRTIHTV